MKLAYSINGEGFGHAARMVALAPGLGRWHDLTLFVPPSVERFVAQGLPGLARRPLPSFLFSKSGDRIVYSRTIWRSLFVLADAVPRVFRLAAVLRRERFDAVLSDFDPFMAWAGRLAGLPVIQLNHPGVILKFPSQSIQHLAASVVALLMEGPWTKRLHCSFFRGDLGPILRAELRAQTVSRGDYLVVYLKSGYRRQVVEALEALRADRPGLRWELFPDPAKNFPAALAGCRAVISAAGHQMLSESLALGKPILALPQEGQGEQQLNARMLAKSKRGMAARLAELGQALPRFVAALPELEANFALPPPKRYLLTDSSEEAVLRISQLLLNKPARHLRKAARGETVVTTLAPAGSAHGKDAQTNRA